jgi:hypothetical protein
VVVTGRQGVGGKRLRHDLPGVITPCDLDLIGNFDISAVRRLDRRRFHGLREIQADRRQAKTQHDRNENRDQEFLAGNVSPV